MHNNEQSVKEVKAVMEAWGEALCKKDLEAMHKDYAEQYRLFDVGCTSNSAEETKALWEQCFPYFSHPKVEYKNEVIHATDDMVLLYFNSRIHGLSIELPEAMANAWLRGTVCYRKIDGKWQCVHEHISFPVNCETNQIAFEQAA